MSYSNYYKQNDVNFANFFILRQTIPSGGNNPTGFKINGTDLYNIFTPIGTTSNLKYPTSVSFVTNSSTNLSNLFEYNLIDTNNTSIAYTQTPVTNGTVIKITGNGNIKFNCNLQNVRMILVGGGGGGGGTYQDNGAGGGGAGEVCDGTINIDKSFSFSVSLGGGGAFGAVSTNGTTGGNSSVSFGSTTIAVFGGGGGGRGKTSGLNGGSGGGAGSYSNNSTSGGTTNKHQNTSTLTFYGYNGAGGQYDKNDTGRGGGGGGASENGGTNTSSFQPTAGGDGYLVTLGSLTPFYVGGGGAGGAGSDERSPTYGGAGGGGNGGYTISVDPSIYSQATSGTPNTGGGGGGGGVQRLPNLPLTAQKPGASGGSGVCYLYISQSNLIV
jgi:hypothetical protein